MWYLCGALVVHSTRRRLTKLVVGLEYLVILLEPESQCNDSQLSARATALTDKAGIVQAVHAKQSIVESFSRLLACSGLVSRRHHRNRPL